MPNPSKNVVDWRLWWFAQLDAAIDRRDEPRLRKAIRNLERLGIEIRFTIPLIAEAPSDGAIHSAASLSGTTL